ncbi:MAG: glycoside hydrolase [Bacteroidota bacterium]
MKTKVLTTALLLLLSFVVCLAAAAGLNGKWTGSVMVNREDEIELIYNFKVNGEKLSGTVESPTGDELPIDDGVLDGNNFAFTVKAGKYTIYHTGKYYKDSVTVAANVEGKSLKATLKRGKK